MVQKQQEECLDEKKMQQLADKYNKLRKDIESVINTLDMCKAQKNRRLIDDYDNLLLHRFLKKTEGLRKRADIYRIAEIDILDDVIERLRTVTDLQ